MPSKEKKSEAANLFARRNRGYVRSLFLRILAIIGIAVALGFVNMLGNKNSPKYGKGMVHEEEITFDKLPYMENILWVDARPAKDYDENHVRDAVLINEDNYYVNLSAIVSPGAQGKTVIVYCASEECTSGINIVRLIRKDTGLKEVFSLVGGWVTIQANGLPTVSVAQEREEAKERLEAEKKKEKEAAARAAAKELMEDNSSTSATDSMEGE